jgi:uncharacterized protein
MKTNIIAMFIFLFTSMNIYSQQQTPPAPVTTIEVSGTSVIKVTPDILRMSVNIQVDMDDVEDAKKKNDASTTKVLAILKDNGIEQREIQTSGIQITKRTYVYSTSEKKFQVTNAIWFSTNDIKKYDVLTSQIIKIDDAYIGGANLDYSKAAETRAEARIGALNAAKKKAEDMASVYGLTVIRATMIQEEIPYSYYPNAFNNVVQQTSYDVRGETGTQTFSEGMVNIEAKVKVIFELK